MSAQPEELDPFADSEKSPAISFKDAAVGTVITAVVTSAPKTVQSRDYDTGEPAYWPAKQGETPNPKMSVVINVEVDGEARSVWAQKPSALFAAIGEARKLAGQPIAVGGTLAIKFTGEKPNATNPRLNPAKQYAARYTPPAAPDAFAEAGTISGAPTAPVAAAPWDDPPPF